MNKEAIFRSALNTVYYTGVGRMVAPTLKGIGAFMMLHHILPGGGLQKGFAPNAGLEITPQFLSDVIQFVRNRGYQIVSIEESYDILSGRRSIDKPFVVFTIDDGYRDNLQHAYPVFSKHKCPFAIFIAPQITDGKSELWWRGLEQAINQNSRLQGSFGNEAFDISCDDESEKKQAFEKLYWPLRNLDEFAQRKWIRGFCNSYDIDLNDMCANHAMDWDEVRTIASDPLCTIGAHTINHYAVSKLDKVEAQNQATMSRDRIEKEIGERPEYFAYPYGDEGSAGPRDFELMKQAGFKMALTTRKGLIYDQHKQHLTALPRLSLNGAYQELHYVEALLSGLPFAMFNKFKKLNVA